ncbi:ankyrin repeat-containing domain protein [Baffinella frigidus]|nr:ankyrin repeat-containing domain protein [Cryptophyta sp. CCMP2293]
MVCGKRLRAVLAVLALEAGAALVPAPRIHSPPALAFSAAPLLNFLSGQPHTSRSAKTCSSLPRTRAAPLRTGRASGALLLAAKVEGDLAEAVSEGNVQEMLSLLAGGADAGGGDDWGATVLHLAVKRGHLEAAKVLLEAGAVVHKASTTDDETSPLHAAAGAGNAPMVALLLSHGARVAKKDEFGDTPYDIALRSKHTKVAELLRPGVEQSRLDDKEFARKQKEAKAEMDAQFSRDSSKADFNGFTGVTQQVAKDLAEKAVDWQAAELGRGGDGEQLIQVVTDSETGEKFFRKVPLHKGAEALFPVPPAPTKTPDFADETENSMDGEDVIDVKSDVLAEETKVDAAKVDTAKRNPNPYGIGA